MTLKELSVSMLAQMSRPLAERAIRARVQSAYLGDKLLLARILGHPKIFLSTEDLGFACHLMLDGYWEIWLTQFFARIVRPGMTIIDVGANFGYYTLLFGGAVGSSGQVIAIEPVPATAALLRKTIELNGLSHNTRLIIAAAGDHATHEAHMIIPPNEPKNATIVPSRQGGSFPVPSVPIDRLTDGLHRLDLVKVDAEGAEVAIFDGMKATIARFRPKILLEFNAARCTEPRRFLADIAASYPGVRTLDFDGNLQPTPQEVLVDTRLGEDWLLYLEP